MPLETNALYYGDNLDILRKYIPDNSVDLIYLDPPFNSSATYNVLFKEPGGESSQAQISAFEDTWHWGIESERALMEIAASPIAPAATKDLISVLPNLVGKHTDMAAYLVMMCIRLVEMRRVLKDTGSLYLHCDPTASHYLKIMLDTIFGPNNYCNNIVWQRSDTHNDAKNQFSALTDHILFYRNSEKQIFHRQHTSYPQKTMKEWYLYLELPDGSIRRMTHIERETQEIPTGARRFNTDNLASPNPRPNLMYEYKGYPYPSKGWRCSKQRMEELDKKGLLLFPSDLNGRIMFKRYLDEQEGVTIGDVWIDISQLRAAMVERLGYPTQKPEALLERIIKASSNEGDVVLDPFCGCGTALVAAEKLKRKWIGIDITHLAIGLMKWRLKNLTPPAHFSVHGEPKDLAGAVELANQDKYQFQWWAVSQAGGQPYGERKKGADTGIDGYLYYMDEKDKIKKAIISVKGGHNANVSMIRDLGHVIDREKSDIGVFISVDHPTRPMIEEAAMKGFYHSPLGRDYPRLQILTIEEILSGKLPEIPPWIAPVPGSNATKKKVEQPNKLL
jgi:site-specific DNA-methyltransferase (adenine-specific)